MSREAAADSSLRFAATASRLNATRKFATSKVARTVLAAVHSRDSTDAGHREDVERFIFLEGKFYWSGGVGGGLSGV